MSVREVPEPVRPLLSRLGVELEDAQLDQCAHFLSLLLEANRRFNLTAIRDPAEAWPRHIVDSLTALFALQSLESGDRLIDVGAGGGLPGIPLAIARPDLQVTLLEATGKKARFLESCVEALGLTHVSVVNDRAETIGQRSEHRQRYDVAVCRAIGPMNVLLELTMPLIRVGGMLVAMKGPKAEEELRACGDGLETLGAGQVNVFDAYPEDAPWDTVIVTVCKERPTPQAYPRLPGVPKQSPL